MGLRILLITPEFADECLFEMFLRGGIFTTNKPLDYGSPIIPLLEQRNGRKQASMLSGKFKTGHGKLAVP